MNMEWRYGFDAWTSGLGSDPGKVPPGNPAFVAGVDGRFDGELRRFPGFVRLSGNQDVSALGDPASLGELSVTWSRYVTFQKMPGSSVVVRGFLVADSVAGALEFWYRFSDDSTGVIRRKDLTSMTGFLANVYYDVCTRRNYMYLVSAGGPSYSFTIYWDSNAGDFVARQFGPDSAALNAIIPGYQSGFPTSGGRAVAGNYGFAYRYRDTKRNRYTRLSGMREQTLTANQKTCLQPSSAYISTPSTAPVYVHTSGTTAAINGGKTIVTLAGSASATNDAYNGYALEITDTTSGTVVETRRITDYDGSSKQATVATAFGAGVDAANSTYRVLEVTHERVQVFSTISSGASTEPAGGTFYKAYEGLVDLEGDNTGATDEAAGTLSRAGYWEAQLFVAPGAGVDVTGANAGAASDGEGATSISDNSLPGLYAYDLFDDEINRHDAFYAIAHFQDVTYGLVNQDASGAGAYLDIVHSSPNKLDPENFPTTNVYRTRIQASQGHTCRFVEAADYLYLFGGNSIYRVQRVGATVGFTELLQGTPFIHKDAIVRVGSAIFAATENSILQVDARSGSASVIPGLDRLFRDRWKGAIQISSASSQSTTLRGGYDARMQCVFFHLPSVGETLCLWLGTGKISLLLGMNYQGVVSGPDLETGDAERAYFVSGSRYFVAADHNESMACQSFGCVPYGSSGGLTRALGEAPDTETISAVAYKRIKVGTGSDAFTTNGSTALNMRGALVWFLTGAEAGNCYRVLTVSSSNANRLVLNHTAWKSTGPASGDVVAVGPVPMVFVGCPLWSPKRSTTDFHSRRIVTGLDAFLGRLSASNVTWTSDFGVLKAGVARHHRVLERENHTTPPYQWSTGDGFVYANAENWLAPGALPSAENPDSNYVTIQPYATGTSVASDGIVLLPWVMSLVSGTRFSVYSIRLEGSFENALIAGR